MRVCILSLSRIGDDPRVRRQGDAVHGAGHDVLAVGLGGARSAPPAWRVVELDDPSLGIRRALTAARGVAGRFGTRAALAAYWTSRLHRAMYSAAAARDHDLVIANDWRVLPIALRVAVNRRARVHYDSHEYATQERADSRAWRLFIAPLVRQIEGSGIREVGSVSTVADGIADAMRRDYGLPTRPTVIRNVPDYRSMPLRPPRDGMEVLFHGALFSDRGLEPLVRSVPLWQRHLRLTIRGPGERRYIARLTSLAEELGVTSRVTFEPPVPMTELVAHANTADIGMFLLDGTTPQLRYALPNKIFEYVMAGLAVCATDLPEASRIVRENDIGVAIARPEPNLIAEALNRMTPDTVARFKSNALEAAKVLCWDNERERLLRVLGMSP